MQQRIQQEGAPIGYFTKGSEDYDKKSALRSFLLEKSCGFEKPCIPSGSLGLHGEDQKC